jgi:hypothetical protein
VDAPRSPESQQQDLVYARASIHLPGLPLGQAALVDPSDPYIADALEHGYLVPETAPEGAR